MGDGGGRGLVTSQEPLWGMERPSLPALVPESSFTSWSLSFAILFFLKTSLLEYNCFTCHP